MTDRKIVFCAGLPRSGSTLLVNLLGQNPAVHVTPTSGLIEVLVEVRNRWGQLASFQALPADESDRLERGVLRGMLRGYFEHTEAPVCVDKNRGWCNYLELAAELLGGRDRVYTLVTVRDLRDVIASFEMAYRRTAALGRTPQEVAAPLRMRTALGRLQVFVADDGVVGSAYNAVRDAVTRGWRDRIHFVEFGALTRHPERTLEQVYDFIGEARHDGHRFDRVEQLTVEDDRRHGFRNLHDVAPTVEARGPRWPTVYDATVTEHAAWKQVEQAALFWRGYLTSEWPAAIAPPLSDGTPQNPPTAGPATDPPAPPA